ncbi:16S rRNA (cytosine(1402)-N(4))-methyltransferase RsmH [Panacagrimonas sp.]|uniref:16S rRNA (cytosine(1402)-N(4))-methyltransferase RsmH n=1 Tax=Panacagrimonas sp. TaxID=2480088 RepID=UPI003B51C3A3
MPAHRPVMLDEALAGLALKAGGTYVDATFGRGGHSAAILTQIGPHGVLHALDHDPEACRAAASQFAGRTRFHFHRRNFSALGAWAREQQLVGKVDGLLLDLGVSSPQLDDAARGFSFVHDGPLDMRMDPDAGMPAAHWLATAEEGEIAEVLWTYGEERASRRIARRLVAARAEAPITRTTQLAELIARAVPGPRQKIHPATRSFQAIRIHINGELDALKTALDASLDLLAGGGRLAVISFHSLEDRIVKRFVREASSAKHEAFDPTQVLYDARLGSGPTAPAFRVVGRVFPSDAECADNPRARSAVLRVAERRP